MDETLALLPRRPYVKMARCMLAASLVAIFISHPSAIFADDTSGVTQGVLLTQKARAIYLLMFEYACDHGNKYPDGKSSTEVFQKLLDGKYTTDPALFYYELPGKTRPTSNVLKPENVSWDVTIAVTHADSDHLPMVFLTGYKIQYAADGGAILVASPSPDRPKGIAVCYKGNSAMFLKDEGLANQTILHFICGPIPAGKKFQQLTPDGPLP